MNTKEEKFLVCRDETIEYSRTSVKVKHLRPIRSVQNYFVGTFPNALSFKKSVIQVYCK